MRFKKKCVNNFQKMEQKVKGKFLSPEIDTSKKMQTFCIEKMKKDGMNAILAWIFTRSIPKLERWKK